MLRGLTRGARNWLVLAAIVATFVAAYAVAGFYGVPYLVRSQLASFVSEHYGRQVSIGAIRFNPFTFDLEARDVSLPDADRQPMLSFGRLRLDLDVATIWRAAPSFAAIELEQPSVRTVIRPDGSLNLADLAKPFESTEPPPAKPDKPARLFVDRLSVMAGETRFEDQSRPRPFRALLRPIAFELRDFSTTGKTDNAYSLAAASAAGERFAWQGTFTVAPLASRGRFEVNALKAQTVASYLQDALSFELSGGQIDLNGEYALNATQALNLTLDVHSVSIADLGLRPRGQGDDYIQYAGIQVDGTHLDLARQRVDVKKIALTGGTVRAWRNTNGTINLMELAPASDARTATLAGAANPPSTTQPAGAANAASAAQSSSTTTSARPSRQPTASIETNAPVAAAPTPDPANWTLSAPDISVSNLRVDVEDRMVKPTARFALTPINLNVRGFSTAPDTTLEVDAHIGIDSSGTLTAKGTTSPETGALSTRVDLKGFDLETLQPYVSTYTQITLLSGRLNTSLNVERSANGALDVQGDTEVTKLRTIDNALRQDLVKWDQLRVEGVRYKTGPADSDAAPTLRIATLSARAPYARLIIAPDQTLNITKALEPTPGSTPQAVQTVQTQSGETKAPGGNPGALQMSIGTVKITNGSANFADFWIQPNYAVSLQGLNGTIAGLSSDPKTRAKVALEGKVDRYAPAKIGGEINLLSAALFTDMKVSFKGVELTSVTPYSGRFAGYKIEKGKLSIDVAYHVEDRKLDAKQRFVVDQLQLGERVESPDAVKLPLRLAVALLKDRNGVIDLNLPVTGSLDDPQFRIGPIIWKAFVGLLTKVATAPFALLGSLFGGGEEMNRIDFEPGVATLDATAQERVASLAKALKERPQLQLDVPMPYSPDADGAVLASAKLNEKLTALASQETSGRTRGGTKDTQATAGANGSESPTDTVLSDPGRKFELLHAQYQVDFGKDATPPAATAALLEIPKKKRDPTAFTAANDELTQAILEKEAVSDRDFEQLAQARARAVQDALLSTGEIDPARVFLLGAAATKPADGKVRLEMSLK